MQLYATTQTAQPATPSPPTSPSTCTTQSSQTQRSSQDPRPLQPNISTPPTPTETPTQPNTVNPLQESIQTPNHSQLDNIHWGDFIENSIHSTFGINLKISTPPNIRQLCVMEAAMALTMELSANFLCFQEINLCWDSNNHKRVHQIFHKSHDANKISVHQAKMLMTTSINQEVHLLLYLDPGYSTFMVVVPIQQTLGHWVHITLQTKCDVCI